ncbi:cell filamentation protein Fic [Bacteroidia bacterium]|nr:cell filamentation protein Fic [Bacteroidia bacterium]
MYTPPFEISTKSINLIAEISAQIERYAIRMEQVDGLRLRKINRIKTIQGSLAIEGNTLTESQITDILDGKPVVAPIREIQEVRNAIRVYDLFETLNPFSLTDLKRAHGVMMEALIDEAGHFRRGGVGVVSGKQVIHLAPPADNVPFLMQDLFEWLQNAEDHLLIRSCVFHYEFEFIHPFSDGNGRMGRLWQSLILSRLHPVFANLPVENMVFANQQGYYTAINRSTTETNSGIFADFMLQEIFNTLKSRQGKILQNDVGVNVGVNVGVKSEILNYLKNDPTLSAKELAALLNKTQRTVERNIRELREQGMLKREGSDKTGVWKINFK